MEGIHTTAKLAVGLSIAEALLSFEDGYASILDRHRQMALGPAADRIPSLWSELKDSVKMIAKLASSLEVGFGDDPVFAHLMRDIDALEHAIQAQAISPGEKG